MRRWRRDRNRKITLRCSLPSRVLLFSLFCLPLALFLGVEFVDHTSSVRSAVEGSLHIVVHVTEQMSKVTLFLLSSILFRR